MESKKALMPIRYAMLVLFSLFFIAVIALLILAGVLMINEHLVFSLLLFILALSLLIFTVIKIKRAVSSFKNRI